MMESIAAGLPEYRQEIIVCQDDRHKKSAHGSYKGIPVYRCRQLADLASTPVSLRYLYEVKKRTADSDFVIYHFPYPMVDLAVLLGMYSGRLVVWWHCGFEKYKKLAYFYRPLVMHTLNKADRILVSSKRNIENSEILRKYRGKCRVIPYCVSDGCLQRGRAYRNADSVQKGKTKEPGTDVYKSSLQKAGPYGCKRQICILFIGRLVWYKGCDILLRAFAMMQDGRCRLVLVGSGPMEQELKNLASSLKLSNVEFAGIVSEKEKMSRIEQCDFLVLPSISKAEAFAVVQLEAMAFGKPVINTALPSGVPSVSIDRVTGRTVAPGNVRELAAAMRELAWNDDLRNIYGRQACKRVQENFTGQLMADRHRKVFRQMLEEDMRIAFDGQLLLAADKTGIAWNAHNLISGLLKYTGNEYTLQCLSSRKAIRQIPQLDEYRKAGCRVECGVRFSYVLYKLMRMVVPIPHRMFFRTKADVTLFFNYVIPPGVRGKRAVFVYDMSYKACPDTLNKKTEIWLKKNMKQTCRRADCIITISKFSKQEIIKYLKVPAERIHIVPCAVDHKIYHPHYATEQIQKVLDQYGILQEYFLYVGTIEPRKNLERLIGAYAKLCRRYSGAPQLVLAGKRGWKCSGIYEKARGLEAEGKILFTGYIKQEDSPVLMCGAKAFVFPSLYEGFGMPPLEAMACGTAVITSNTTALGEIAGKAAITVNPENEEEICRAMERVLSDHTYRQQLERLGIQRAQEYTWQKSAAKLLEICKSLG